MPLMQEKQEKFDQKQLESLISNAVKKIQGRSENDICRYLPVETGGHIHHFTMRKMKTTAPQALQQMISQYIIETEVPATVKPKPRAARGSRKRKDQVVLSKQDVERILSAVDRNGNREVIRKLIPKRDLRALKKELITAIKNNLHGPIEQELWSAYVESVASYQP